MPEPLALNVRACRYPLATPMPEDDKQKSVLGRASSVGIEFAAAVAGLSLVGIWVDRHYGSGPWGLVIGLSLGLIGGTYNLVRETLLASKDAERSDRGER